MKIQILRKNLYKDVKNGPAISKQEDCSTVVTWDLLLKFQLIAVLPLDLNALLFIYKKKKKKKKNVMPQGSAVGLSILFSL